MSTRGPKIDSLKAARAKEKRQRKMPAEDRPARKAFLEGVKSHLRRLERK